MPRAHAWSLARTPWSTCWPTATTSRCATPAGGGRSRRCLGALALLLNGGGLGQIRTVTTELDAALQDDASVRRFLEELDSFVGALDRNRGRIIRVMENVDRLARTVAEDRER